MTNASAGVWVAALCLAQAGAGVAALAGWRAPAAWAALACPLAVLLIVALRIGWGPQWAALKPLEVAFLAANAASALLAAALLALGLRAGGAGAAGGAAAATPTLLLALHWLLNSVACAAMVYLAFFFRLF